MSSYLLPCVCGEKTPVTASQAGQSVRCACGAQLEVPTLRGLRDLAPADSVAVPTRSWSNRHRSSFVAFVLALAAFAVSGLLALKLPPAATVATDQQIEEVFEKGSTAEIYATYQELQKGIAHIGPEESAIHQYLEQRISLLWGIRVMAALGVLGLVAAAVIALVPGTSKK